MASDLRPSIMTAIEGFERSWIDVTMQNISKRVRECDQSAPLDTMSCDCMTYIRGMLEAAVSRGAKAALYTFGDDCPTDGMDSEIQYEIGGTPDDPR